MVRRLVVFGGVRVSFVTIGLYFRNEHVPIYKLVRKVKWPENFPAAGSWAEVVVVGGGSEGGREREKCVCFLFVKMKLNEKWKRVCLFNKLGGTIYVKKEV